VFEEKLLKDDHIPALEAYFHLMNANGVAHVYRTAVEVGILDALKKGPLDSSSVAKICGISEMPTRLVLDVLQSLSVVEFQKQGYALTDLARFLLDSPYLHLGDPYWAYLPTFIRTNTPMMKMNSVEVSETQYQVQAAAMSWMLTPVAEEAARIMGFGEAERKNFRILDIGAGSAVWSLTMARRDSGTSVTAVDWPAVLRIAEETARRAQIVDRFSTIPGNFHEAELPAVMFDLAILGNVTHLESPEGNRSLFSRLRRALKPGGQVAIFDIFSGQVEGDLNRTLYSLGLALRTEHGHVYSAEELNEILSQTGFTTVSLTPLKVPPYAISMLLANNMP
jgi:ubiquinone/menaquinone biosynthesis C-methylase UbiE